MRAIQRPNLWAAGVLSFCLAVWGVSLVAVAKTAHIYTHKSPAGFRHDLMAHAKVRWHELKSMVGAEAAAGKARQHPGRAHLSGI